MRPAEFSDDDIINAGQQLEQSGRRITGFALRQVLGGGTPNRLKQVWDDSRRQPGMSLAPVAAIALPVELQSALDAFSAQLSEQLKRLMVDTMSNAEREAKSMFETKAAELAKREQQSEQELIDAMQTIEQLENQTDALQGDLRLANDKITTAAHMAEGYIEIVAKLEEKNKQHKAKIDDLQAALSDAQEQIKNERTEAQTHKEALDMTKGHLDSVQADCEAKLRDIVKLQKELAEEKVAGARAQDKVKTSAAEIVRAGEKVTKADAECREAKKEAAAAREEAAHVRGELAAMKAQVSHLTKVLAGTDNAEKKREFQKHNLTKLYGRHPDDPKLDSV